MRGHTERITVGMNVQADGETFEANGTFVLTHTAFGFEPYTNLMGTLRNENELDFVVDVVGSAVD